LKHFGIAFEFEGKGHSFPNGRSIGQATDYRVIGIGLSVFAIPGGKEFYPKTSSWTTSGSEA
jgi:hypothetical protein